MNYVAVRQAPVGNRVRSDKNPGRRVLLGMRRSGFVVAVGVRVKNNGSSPSFSPSGLETTGRPPPPWRFEGDDPLFLTQQPPETGTTR